MKKKTHSLTVLMLKDYIKDAQSAIKDLGSGSLVDIKLGSTIGKLYFKQNPSHPPSWVKLFEPKIGTALNGLFNSGTSAVLLLEAGRRLFALTFGYGKFLLVADCYEENFGLCDSKQQC